MRLLRHSTLVALLVLPGAAHALQALPDGAYAVASATPTATPESVEVRGEGGRVSWVHPGARLVPTDVRVYSNSNANDTFTLSIRSAHAAGTSTGRDCAQALLSIGGNVRVSDSWGGDSDGCMVSFALGPADAQVAAAAFHTARVERSPRGELVTSTFSTPHRLVRRGAQVEIVLALHNPANAPVVRWSRGGADRGPRDDQFDFSVTRDGQPLTNIPAINFGGMVGLVRIGPGETSEELRVPLASWVDVAAPGHYVVQCRYRTVFLPDNGSTFRETLGEEWDRTFEGTVTFDVR